MEYKVIVTGLSWFNDTIKIHQEKVQELITQGWKPQGGIAIAVSKTGIMSLAQAMVRED